MRWDDDDEVGFCGVCGRLGRRRGGIVCGGRGGDGVGRTLLGVIGGDCVGAGELIEVDGNNNDHGAHNIMLYFMNLEC